MLANLWWRLQLVACTTRGNVRPYVFTSPDRPQFPGRSLSTCRWQQGGFHLKFAPQFSNLSVSTLKKDGSFPISHVVVVDQSGELCDVRTQSYVLGATSHGRFPILSLLEFET